MSTLPPEAAATRDPALRAIAEALAVPFDPREVKWKAQMVKNNRAMAIAYVDARLIQDRLDQVLGAENWQDEYESLADGSVVCRLRLRLGGEWVCKMDVGSPSEQPDGGDRLKAAFSGALKRTAVKFGIGRYLYRLPSQWVEYDPVKKQLAQIPQLPAFAIPAAKPATKPTAPPPELADRVAGAANLQDLQAAWEEARAALKSGQISKGQLSQLSAAKDRRKAELTTQPTSPPTAAEPPTAPFTPDELKMAARNLGVAKNPEDLRKLWEQAREAHKAGRMTNDQLAELAAAKDRRKAELAPASPPPPFTGDPKHHPAVADKAGLSKLCSAKGFTYPHALSQLNLEFGTAYHMGAAWDQVPLEHRQQLVMFLLGLPDKAKA